MADYKLSELNSIDTIRSDDLLHIRVKKRTDMLGDEDRRMTYADFLASFKLERFLQLVGGTMTGNLGIVKLTYGGKDLLDPTGNSEIVFGDTAKTFKLNSNGLKLTIADASRSATVYHTLNKPSPNELGMRTNDENDARFAIKGTSNTFIGSQIINANSAGLTLKNTSGAALYYEGRDTSNAVRFTLGNAGTGSDVTLSNTKQGTNIVLGTDSVGINKQLQVTGRVVPSDFANFDARFYTQNAADQRFVQLAGTNNITGNNTFRGAQAIKNDGPGLALMPNGAGKSSYIISKDSDGATNRWYLGFGSDNSTTLTLRNYILGSSLQLASEIIADKSVNITGQVKPSDWDNIDSRYIPAATLSNLAKLNVANTFTNTQTIVADNEGLFVKNLTQNQALYIRGVDTKNVSRWWLGIGKSDSNEVTLYNDYFDSKLTLGNTGAYINKTLAITGQVQPSDWGNLDARYFTQSASDSRYLRIRSTGFNISSQTNRWAKIATVVMPQSASTAVIEVFGGSGFNFNRPDQAGKCEIVLRTANNSPKGLNVVAWRTSDNSIITDVGCVNTSGDTYDIYCLVGPYQNGTTSRVQSSGNASVQLFEVPQLLDDAPQGIVKGTLARYYTSLQKPSPSDIGAYTKAETDQKIAEAISNSTDLNKIYPVGIVTWFATNNNPNTSLPGLTWTYLNDGVGKTIRVGAESGSDVATTGGSDSKTIAVGNLPSHTHSFSATTSSFDYGNKTTSSFDYGTKTTNTTGAHTHTYTAPTSTTVKDGDYNQALAGTGTRNTGSSGDHAHTVGIGAHTHTVGIGAHTHTVSGDTGGTGSGSAFDVTNSYIKLMAWVRTA